MAHATYATLVTFRMDLARESEQRAALHDVIVPSVRSAPGFVSGTWTVDRDAGTSIVLVTFDDRVRADSFAESVRANAPHQLMVGIELVSITIVEVVAAVGIPQEASDDDFHLDAMFTFRVEFCLGHDVV